MKDIPFTQFIRPYGRKLHISILRPDEIAEQASELVANQIKFEIEELRTGEVSMTAEDYRPGAEEPTLAIEVVPNGPEVVNAVDRLITRAYTKFKHQ